MNESKPEVRANAFTLLGWQDYDCTMVSNWKDIRAGFTFFSSVFHVFMRPPPIPLDVSKTYPNSWPSLYDHLYVFHLRIYCHSNGSSNHDYQF